MTIDIVAWATCLVVFVAWRRQCRIFRERAARDNWIILNLAGRVADLSQDEDERRRATDLFRALTEHIIEDMDRTT